MKTWAWINSRHYMSTRCIVTEVLSCWDWRNTKSNTKCIQLNTLNCMKSNTFKVLPNHCTVLYIVTMSGIILASFQEGTVKNPPTSPILRDMAKDCRTWYWRGHNKGDCSSGYYICMTTKLNQHWNLVIWSTLLHQPTTSWSGNHICLDVHNCQIHSLHHEHTSPRKLECMMHNYGRMFQHYATDANNSWKCKACNIWTLQI